MNDFVSLKHIYKVYPNGVEAVHDFNLDIAEHEFIVIVGPSGCGKSTTLRMVAGLEDITDGKLLIAGDYSNEKTPRDRNIAMVFQSYSLYPHMTVFDNIAFGLKMRKYPFPLMDKEGKEVLSVDQKEIKKCQKLINSLNKELEEINASIDLLSQENEPNEFLKKKLESLNERKSLLEAKIQENTAKVDDLTNNPRPKVIYRHLKKQEIEERVNSVAKILELNDYLSRKPAELSGGQRQRVALGRAIIRDARVFLMDEPLSNLDAKLRVTMRSEIIKLHEKINATIIYVTHDQTEAMTMADRIVVMKDGYIQQIGTPSEIYDNPHNIFVANFIGAPAMNIVKAKYDLNNVSLENGFAIKLSKEQKESFKKFYNEQIEDYNRLLNLLNTDIEEVSISLFESLKPFLLGGCKDHKKCALSIINKLSNPLMESLKKIQDGLKISLNQEGLLEEEKTMLRGLIEKDIKRFNSLYKTATLNVTNNINSNFASLVSGEGQIEELNLSESLLDRLQYFKADSESELVKQILKHDEEKFKAILSLVDFVVKKASQLQSTGLLYALHMIETLKELLLELKKVNKEDLLAEVDKLLEEVHFDVIKEDVNQCVQSFDKKLHKVLCLSDSDIRILYFTALRTRGQNERIDWILSLVDQSIKSKRYENRLRNEYLIEVLIEELINEFKKRMDNPHDLLFGIRPEDIHLDSKWNKEKYPHTLGIELEVGIVELLGKEYILHLNLGEDDLLCQMPNELRVSLHDKLKLLLDETKIHLFDSITEKTIL